MQKGRNEKYNLICIAHPDDETIFFGGVIQRLNSRPWRVICLTDGNADGKGHLRKRDFERAMKTLKVRDCEWWAYPDIYERRLPVAELVARLRELPTPHEVYTHGPLGEYGHPHHQDACVAVHRAFPEHPRLFSVAYNALPDRRIDLTEREYAVKTRILADIYGSETTRFLNLLPATHTEGLVRLDLREVEALYEFLTSNEPQKRLNVRAVARYRWMAKILSLHRDLPRPF